LEEVAVNKALRALFTCFVLVLLLLSTFAGGVVAGRLVFENQPAAGLSPVFAPPTVPADTGTPQDLETLFKPFWETWSIIHDQFVEQPLDDEALMRGAIRGMLGALDDQHTWYMDPEEYQEANRDLGGEYDGIGAWVDVTGEYLTIITPMPGSPAEQAGLRPGDQIVAIDGEDMTGIDSELARRRVLGPAGTTVNLTIRREGVPEPLEFSIVRARIIVASVEGEMLDDGIAYIRLLTFGDKTTQQLRDTLRELLAENPRGLILDLRNNGGGYLITAIEVASQFIAEGVIMYEQYGDGSRDVYNARSGGLATEIPLVVLINEGTASASEIVAGAIQDYGRGQLVGMTSFGKGSVQNWVALSDEQGAVRVTIAKWLTPDERTIHGIGLTPDLVVERTEEDFDAGLDPQLEAAIRLLLEMTAP
jgi:carboxyl-terminal processing protease